MPNDAKQLRKTRATPQRAEEALAAFARANRPSARYADDAQAIAGNALVVSISLRMRGGILTKLSASTDHVEALNNRGSPRRNLHRGGALMPMTRRSTINPDHIEANLNRGI